MKNIFFLLAVFLNIGLLGCAEKEGFITIEQPVLSHNRKHIAFCAISKCQEQEKDNFSSLWYINLENRNLVKIDNIGVGPSWSCDNEKIVYCSYSYIKIFDIKTNKYFFLKQDDYKDLEHIEFITVPRWSPKNPTLFAFVASTSPRNHSIYLFDLSDKQTKKLTDIDNFGGWGWSPCGKYIYYAVRGEEQLWRADINSGTKEKLLTKNNVVNIYSIFGKMIFTSFVVSAEGIYYFDFYVIEETQKGIVHNLWFPASKRYLYILESPVTEKEIMVFKETPEDERAIEIINTDSLEVKKIVPLGSSKRVESWISSSEILISDSNKIFYKLNIDTLEKKTIISTVYPANNESE